MQKTTEDWGMSDNEMAAQIIIQATRILEIANDILNNPDD